MSDARKDYPCIVVWHKQTGSFNYYIDNMCERAQREGAPRNALYNTETKRGWVTLDDLAPDHSMRPMLEAALNAK